MYVHVMHVSHPSVISVDVVLARRHAPVCLHGAPREQVVCGLTRREEWPATGTQGLLGRRSVIVSGGVLIPCL